MAAPGPQAVSSSADGRDVANITDAVAAASISAPPAAAAGEQQPKAQKNTAKSPKQKAPKAGKGGADAAGGSGKMPLEMTPAPEFFAHRISIFEKLKAEQDAHAAEQAKLNTPIKITMPDGSVRDGVAWQTSPMDIARSISKSLSERICIAKVNDVLWDLERPFEADSSLALFDFDTPEGKRVFWHSSAHVLGEAAERHYGCHLCIGPPTDDGFFYEMGMGLSPDRVVRQEDYPALESIVNSAIKEKQKFERCVVTKDQLLEMFHYNQYKKHIISSKIPDGTSTTVYRCGPMVDLCVGPHIPHTGRIKAMSVLKNSASYFLGDQNNDSLQRIYGISFPDKKLLEEYKRFLLEAERRDHRKIGKEQELFFFHEMSPGSSFWLPHGTRIYNTLMEYIRSEYMQRGYTEVISPNMYNKKLWETSGHWANYRDDMFSLGVDKDTFALKPMNCPGHCLMFASRDRSYRDLPMRYAEFGVIHRNEASGALSGLTRVRRFVQDDSHIFCMASQIEEEVTGVFEMLKEVYSKFGFEFRLALSTRPDNYLGELDTWNEAERRLTAALDKFTPGNWDLNPGDGAFYGPKIDFTIKDAMRRSFQCATLQLDFQLPQRFKLEFRNAAQGSAANPGPAAEEGKEKDAKEGAGAAAAPSLQTSSFERPVMIHRAILGSFERFIGILTEHYAGKWPFWLSPRQVIIIPVTKGVYDYAEEVRKTLWDAGLFTDVDVSENTLPKKILSAEKAQYNFILVVGVEEATQRSVNVRNRDAVVLATKDAEAKGLSAEDVALAGKKGKQAETVPLDKIKEQLLSLKNERRLENRLL
ncbi:threonyl-tRNA synthetase [Tilletia horrida]|uniref:threonine--tRNA ligase n=1 Tax=Tilletia horrida TaxID=155126 RepID=A0AAN6GAT0_9BASI|nr:threonyl-tRNA synthetase [Tilletia horrida]